jgi:hypothetical protein
MSTELNLKAGSLGSSAPGDNYFSEDSKTYEARRQELKLGWLSSAILLFQATVEQTPFTLPKPMANIGLLPAFLLTGFVCLFTVYGITFYTKVADIIEEEKGHTVRLKNAAEICDHINSTPSKLIKYGILLGSMGTISCSTVASICMLGGLLLLKSTF